MTLFQPKSGILTVQYEPSKSTRILENPPRFTWMAAQLEDDQYILQISEDIHFSDELTLTFDAIPYNCFTPDCTLLPGSYYWRYALLQASVNSESQSEWSAIRQFKVEEDLPETPMPSRAMRYKHTTEEHPRLWLDAQGISKLRQQITADGTHCGWDEFVTKSVLPWLERDYIPEPQRYPNNKRVAKLWRKAYIDCQECLYAIRHLSVAGVILQDADMIERAKSWLMHVGAWDAEGTTSRDYNDEAAFRVSGALAWGYDWLHSYLTESEKVLIRNQLLRRTEQVATHIIERSKIHQVPYDSHAVRSLSSVLVPCCIVLLHEEQQAREWLDYTLEYYATIYTPWGGEDGGWAEGPLYWTTGMAYVIDAMNLIKKYVGIDFYKRPFFNKTGDFPLYCAPPHTIRASFGDQSFLGDPPGLKTGYNIRQFAGVTGNGLYQWYYEQVRKSDIAADSKFYNYGWWDFRFDNLLYTFDYGEFASVLPDKISPIKWFRDIGWVAMHDRMDDPEEHIMLLTKSSKYGSISHSHGDQNNFVLHAYGEPLAIESGHYVAFGSTMHFNWSRQTLSTNSILIDGKGQYAGRNKVLNMQATGTIEEVREGQDYVYSRANATAAYMEHVPYLTHYTREIYFFNQSYFVIIDTIDLKQRGEIEWLFHTLYPMQLSSQNFKVVGEKADMKGQFVYSSSGDLTLMQHDQFIGVDPDELDGLSNQWHLHAATPSAQSHRLVTILTPMKKGEDKYISHFMDDQDHGVHMYFTDEGVTHMIEIQKAY